MENNKYTASSIVREEGSAKFRRGVSRFLGSGDKPGIRNQMYEILDNSVDETVRYAREIKAKKPIPIDLIINEDDSVMVADYGGGIPCEIHPVYGEPTIQIVCESDSAGGKSRGTSGYEAGETSGTHGAGMAVAIACTEYTKLEVNSISAGGRYELNYSKGNRAGELKRVGDLEHKTGEMLSAVGVSREENPSAYLQGGTKITFKYDNTVFTTDASGDIFDKQSIEKRLKLILIDTDGSFYIRFKFKNDSIIEVTNQSLTPEMLLDSDNLVNLKFGTKEVQPFRASLHLKFSTDLGITRHEVLVNRLRMVKSTASDCIETAIYEYLVDMQERYLNVDPYVRRVKIQKNKVKLYFSSLLVMSLVDATYGGQTKDNLTSVRYQSQFKYLLGQELAKSQEAYRNFFIPFMKNEIDKIKRDERIAKDEERRAKAANKRKEDKEADAIINNLKKDRLAYAENKNNSRITIKDSRFDPGDCTLVYVEGKSAGSVLNNIHEDGDIPVTIAICEGNMPNVISDPKNDKEMVRDNRVMCLERGYRDIAIFTDADSDGLHIKLLHLTNILRYAKHYLDEGKVYLIPAPYSKVYIDTPMILELYGHNRIYPVGDNYTYSAKEHQSLMHAGARKVKVFTGLADSDLSPTVLLKERENWIQLQSITAEDIRAMQQALSEEERESRNFYTAETFSYRQFVEKYTFNVKDEIEIDKDDRIRLLDKNELDDQMDFTEYYNLLDTNDVTLKAILFNNPAFKGGR